MSTFTTSDGTQIYYLDWGGGRPVVFSHGWPLSGEAWSGQHLRPQARGGTTSLTGCLLLCPFHHLIAVHRWGWTLALNPDGTTTACSPDNTKVLHSHRPPAHPG